MKPKFSIVFDECLENGIRRGYHRAHKHVENPTEESILENIHDSVMAEFYEWFDFDD
jgi:hypothetical protein